MFIDHLTNADAIPALEASVQFAARRHTLISHNIANLDTPNHQPVDVSIAGFRKQLAQAIDDRRERSGGQRGDLHIRGSREVDQAPDGRIELSPRPAGRNVLFHDRNNRDLERTMQDLVENVAAFRISTELLKTRFAQLNSAIAERV